MTVMKVESVGGISSYYAFIYNRNTGKIFSDSETDDGFADFYNSGQMPDGGKSSGYAARKAGIDSMIDFCSRQGVKNNFFNSSDSAESNIVVENTDNGETKYYVDGQLLLTSIPGEFTSTVRLAPDSTTDIDTDFEDVSGLSISDIKDLDGEENAGPQRKKGTSSEIIVMPDGTRYLITTMYFCGKEIKITKKLPPVDKNKETEDSLLRQDDEKADDGINIDVQEKEREIKANAEDSLIDRLLDSYQPENQEENSYI